MSPRLKRLSGRDGLRVPGAFGFQVVNTRGSHAKLRRMSRDGVRETITVPLHDELAQGTLHAIYRQACASLPMASCASEIERGVPSVRATGA